MPEGAKYFEVRGAVCRELLTERRASKQQALADKEKNRKDSIKRAKKKEALKERRAKEKAERKAEKDILKGKQFIANNEKYYGEHAVKLKEEIEQKEWEKSGTA